MVGSKVENASDKTLDEVLEEVAKEAGVTKDFNIRRLLERMYQKDAITKEQMVDALVARLDAGSDQEMIDKISDVIERE